ncbi:cytochrome P450 704B1 [Cryptomeria japonica]|uniref:cytochrome P450 704B1 n=1 Tax=Cryptomeria japonica TaxID=3369 RepID=UPI0027DA562C|nr:cytochrome P450 704B1 [Cryptomeria japonica]
MSYSLVLSITLAGATLGIWIWIRRLRDRIPGGPIPWPLLGSTLELTANFHRLYDWITDYAMQMPTFEVSYMGFRLFFTVDPANVEYILKVNFHNYVKGSAAHEIQYDLLGDGIFNSDGDMWRLQRKSASLEFSPKMLRVYSTATFRKYAVKLNSVLEQQAINGAVVNMQDMLMRMAFDAICELSFGTEIGCLDLSLPDVPFASAFDRSNAVCASRYFDPLWKLKKRFNIGAEAKVKEDVRVLDYFTYHLIQKRKKSIQDNEVRSKSDLLSRMLSMAKENPDLYDDRKLRDAVLNFVLAGRDGTAVTLSWLLSLLSENPGVEDKIVQELQDIPGLSSSTIEGDDVCCFKKFSELLTYDVLNNNMHYLHAAITETLRLYPAVPLDGKTAVNNDILPDGTIIKKGNVINYVPYAMGRMQRLWGNDALEFKPERWLNEDGIFQPQSPFKFTAFQAGPRICLGKESAYLQMKIAAALLLRFFTFEMVKFNRAKYRLALTLVMPSLPMIVHQRGRKC